MPARDPLGIGDGNLVKPKQSLGEPLDASDLRRKGMSTAKEELRLEPIDRINALGIGARGLEGNTTVLDVKVRSFLTHATSQPVALIPNFTATRHVDFALGGDAPTAHPLDLSDWHELDYRDAWRDGRRFRNRAIYYVGPTTLPRMDSYSLI